MNLFQIQDICKDKVGVIDYLQGQKILHADMQCVPCQHTCTLVKDSAKLSGYFWRCSRCRKKHSMLKDSFLEHSKLSPTKFVYLVFFWATKILPQTTSHYINISKQTVVEYYGFLRDICAWKLLTTPIRLGGPGKEIQVDELLMVKRKCPRGGYVPKDDQMT